MYLGKGAEWSMTRNLKKLSLLCAAVVLINFFSSWYYEELFFHFFVLYSILDMVFFFLFIACGIWAVKYLKGNHKSIKDFIPIIFVVVYLLYLLSGSQNKLNFRVYKSMRYEIVEMVENHQLGESEEKGFVELPDKYKKCSSGGDVFIYRNNDECMIGFWIKRGFLDSGFSMFVYKSDDNAMDIERVVRECLWDGYEVNSEQKEKQWYYIIAREGGGVIK